MLYFQKVSLLYSNTCTYEILCLFRFEQLCRDFEQQKVCYLPLTTLILKPLHRILHYELLLESKLAGITI